MERSALVGNVDGSLVLDADGLTLASGPAGFHDAIGALDGNNDGVINAAGDHAVFTFDFRSTGAGVLSLPAFMRGPGHSVDVTRWLPEHALARAGGSGFHATWLAPPGSQVRRGDPLAEAVDPVLQALRVASHAEAGIARQQLQPTGGGPA